MDSNTATFNVAATFNVPLLCDEAQEREATLTFRSVKLMNVKFSGTDDCYDPKAINYWNKSTSDAGCIYNKSGCTNSGAFNYLLNANTDDGGCTFSVYGCTDATATNFDSTATVLEGCVATHPGCTDSASASYIPGANTDDTSCVYNVYGCSDANALNFDSVATVSVGCVARVEEL